MTYFVGGPDVPGGKTISGYYNLTDGAYVVVDNMHGFFKKGNFG
jgi:hypothetical protein